MTTKNAFRNFFKIACALAITLFGLQVQATTYYVRPGKGALDSNPGTNWNNAKATIQAAISVATNGDLILVTNGTYSLNGGMTGSLSNRVVITNAVTVQSVNGPKLTIITGAKDPDLYNAGNGPQAVRCAYIGGGGVLSGFTLTNGATLTYSADDRVEQNGGGVYCEDGGAVFNCIITDNTGQYTGAIFGGSIQNCIISNNIPGPIVQPYDQLGVGGAVNASLYNCLVISNRGGLCSACYDGSLLNCTVVGNVSTNYAVINSSVDNCIVYYNTGSSRQIDTNNYSLSYTHSCSTPLLPGVGNITNAPLFISPATGNYHLGPGSRCVDSGGYGVVGSTDLDGLPRVFRAPDMGCYERQIPGDYNNDGIVDATDLQALLANYTGGVNQQAVNLVLSNYWPNQLLLNMTNVAGLGTSNVTFALTNSNAGSFNVQSSTDLINWQNLGPAVPAYNFIDPNPPTSTRYYRLAVP